MNKSADAKAQTLGTRIRRARDRKRWTQQQLADAVGVHRITVDAWENDRAVPTHRGNMAALEEVLGVDLAEAAAS